MSYLFTNIIGYIAAVVGIFVMLPQVVKSLKTKKTEDVSMGMVVLYVLNCFLWLIYNVLISATPAVVANAVGLVISVVQLMVKLKYRFPAII